ncbi:DUF378 domain-containing protein [Candidatus Wolfebacteria bacterium CG10_big_fil_rev_8_21_14_0_10_31_9]|uniref:DUF378 domain-containing protein n=1 Tax=Candidatus Wolfebacteria bacterium CG10_big_fil_rev_8_21_14_0_10_31_9 TaxID=1975070 RepID=A0A2H0REK4_9BACT|nr:MAG: DUF378 domain-containing protein [Candidatus Wolfebacteria bacterium CG10_big_fil_rev_8_21_14_0_10_31_9]
MDTVKWIATLLIVIGAINWGLVGAFDFNIVETIFGAGVVSRGIYILVGISGLYSITMLMPKKQSGAGM